MAAVHADDRPQAPRRVTQSSATSHLILPGIEVRRQGRVEPLLHAHPMLSSSPARWSGVALEEYSVPACVIPRHEHVENFLHVVLQGSVRYEVLTRGKTLQFSANPGTSKRTNTGLSPCRMVTRRGPVRIGCERELNRPGSRRAPRSAAGGEARGRMSEYKSDAPDE